MEINEITQERYAEKFKSALKREGLLYKDVAEKFYTSASTLRDMMSGRAPEELQEWSIVRDWAISEKSLRDYKVPIEYKDGFANLAIEKISRFVTSFTKEDEPEELNVQSAETVVRKAVAKMKAKKHKKELAEAIARSVTTEDGTTTVDVSELNQRTGTRVTVDIMEGGYVITVTNLKNVKK